MKPRKVVVTLEIVTDLPIGELKDRAAWQRLADMGRSECGFDSDHWAVDQVQVNAIKPGKSPKILRPKGHA